MGEIEDNLRILNPWWIDGKVPQELTKAYKRKFFAQINRQIGYHPMIILSGLRRVGKTTLLYQIISELLEKVNPRQIIYFNFDKSVGEIYTVLEEYSKITSKDWKKEQLYVFFDEIAKLKEWPEKIKLIYDAFPQIKFFLSSSSSIFLEEDAIKNLGGRYFLINVTPLDFKEFLEMKGQPIFISSPALYKNEITKEFKLYLLRNLPETIHWDNELQIKDYIRTTIIDKTAKADLPEKFKNLNRELILKLLEIFYKEPGIYLEPDSLSKDMKVGKETLLKHIFYLELGYLIRKVKNYRIGAITSSRKMQRVYPFWWTLGMCYANNEDKNLESLIASTIDAKLYWRKNKKEIDFVYQKEGKIIPIEVKNKEHLLGSDLKTIKEFTEINKLDKGIVIYMGDKEERLGNIWIVPVWDWLLKQAGHQ